MDKKAARETILDVRQTIKDNPFSKTGSIYTPSSEMNRFLAKLATNIPLTRELVNEGKLPLNPINQTLAALALSEFLQSLLEPPQLANQDHMFVNPLERQPRERLNTCKSAEEQFNRVLGIMKANANGSYRPLSPDYTIVVDSELSPIAIQKRLGVKSALSLAPITIDGCILPAGSLLDIGFYYENDELILPRAPGILASTQDVATIDLLRLSEFEQTPEGINVLNEHIECAQKCIPFCMRPDGFKA